MYFYDIYKGSQCCWLVKTVTCKYASERVEGKANVVLVSVNLSISWSLG